MSLNMRWRVIIILGAIVLALFAVRSTYRYTRLTESEREGMDPAELQELKNAALRLGLDLQGGMHLVLEIDESEIKDPDFEIGDIMDRALEVIRNRIDEFGVTEPVVQKAGNRRIIVELAGVDDFELAREIISKAAVLEFQMVRPRAEMSRLIDKLDLELAKNAGLAAASSVDDASSDSPDEPFGGADNAAEESVEDGAEESGEEEADEGADEGGAEGDSTAIGAPETPGGAGEEVEEIDLVAYLAEDVELTAGRPLHSRIDYQEWQGRIAVNYTARILEEDYERVAAYLEFLDENTRVIPEDVEFAWHSDTFTDGAGNRTRNLYLLTSQPELTGEMLEDARPQPDNTSNIAGNFLVEFDLNRTGRRHFSRTTGENVGRQMAIVLDGKVRSAPEIQEKIRAGTASITGRFTPEDANALAVVLRAGALPVPIAIEEQRAVGPSLGQDSIRMGTTAILYGFMAVLVFMAIYYRAAGFIAVFALLLNLLFMTAVLVYLDAVLTLPGIAGFVLTVGMAVDANVLIFERIREELRVGQTFRNAVSRGFERAFRTIFDANLTTLITALALLWFGTGPIKGFAITLSIGIVVSMFTALFVSRVVFDLMTYGGRVRRIPI
jgi:protein-export membrane protein SecD